jgi:hypothetical protein
MALTRWTKSLINWLSRLGFQVMTVSSGLSSFCFQGVFNHTFVTLYIAGYQRQVSLVTGAQLGRRDMSSRVRDVTDVVLSLALCHNVSCCYK